MYWCLAESGSSSCPTSVMQSYAHCICRRNKCCKSQECGRVLCLQVTLFSHLPLPKARSSQSVIFLYQYLLFLIRFPPPRQKVLMWFWELSHSRDLTVRACLPCVAWSKARWAPKWQLPTASKWEALIISFWKPIRVGKSDMFKPLCVSDS